MKKTIRVGYGATKLLIAHLLALDVIVRLVSARKELSFKGVTMAGQSKGLTWGLFMLRLGLGGFLALCSVDKIISPEGTVAVFSDYYLLIVAPWAVMILGGAELVLSLFFMLGMYKTWTYGAAFIIQALAMAVVLEKFLTPFGKNHIFLMLIPLLFAFGALFLMRNLDTKWTLTKKTSMFS